MTVMTMSPVADLRSDTVTRPGPAMRKAMAEAEVGDVVFGDDPTVNRLEAVVAERLGKEAALFVPSGTLGNQLGVGAQAGPGDAVLLPAFAHVARWEGGGVAATFGALLVHIADDDGSSGLPGLPGLPSVAAFERHAYGPHPKAPRPVLLALENTHNWAGGRVYGAAALNAHTRWARDKGMRCHLDGARLWNASVASGESLADLAVGFDTVSVCFSKGLGAPIGSCLVGSRDVIARADRLRHRLGGVWRQAGLLAAAALYALEHHVDRLAEDHARAQALGDALVRHGVGAPLHPIETNLVQFAVDPRFGGAQALVGRLAARDVLFFPTGPTTARLVTHLDFGDAALAHVERVFASL